MITFSVDRLVPVVGGSKYRSVWVCVNESACICVSVPAEGGAGAVGDIPK